MDEIERYAIDMEVSFNDRIIGERQGKIIKMYDDEVSIKTVNGGRWRIRKDDPTLRSLR